MTRKIVILLPTYRAAGGVVKLMDYAMHARSLGFEVEVRSPRHYDPEHNIFSTGELRALVADEGVRFEHGFQYGLGPKDFALFSWPKHYRMASTRLTPIHHPLQTIALTQGTRWGNTEWLDGYATRVLAMPMARIFVSPQIADAVEPFLDHSNPSMMILEGHDWPYFHKERSGPLGERVNVAYMTWKSDVGIEVEEHFGDSDEFAFRSIRETASWEEIRELYHWSDIFLGCPLPEEGFYLPGLEAMAAGTVLVTPDVGGNRAYAEFGINCVLVDHDHAPSYIDALTALRSGAIDAEALRSNGYRQLEKHTLERERAEFGEFLGQLDEILGAE